MQKSRLIQLLEHSVNGDNMNIKSKKGYALVMASIFIIILAISSIALYNSVTHVGRDLKVKEKRYVRGYYATIAGLRYASILLRNPNVLTFTNGIYTVTGNEQGGAFFNDIGVVRGTGFGEMSIQIEEYQDGLVTWSQGEYKVTANYKY